MQFLFSTSFSSSISSCEFGLLLLSISLFTCCKQDDFRSEPEDAIKRAYRKTDIEILDKSLYLGRGGSTAVTAILINGEKLVVANVGDSRAVISKNGVAKQLSVDHEPSKERPMIERRGGFVSNLPGTLSMLILQLLQQECMIIYRSTCSFMPWENKIIPTIPLMLAGDVPRVDGQLAVARAFGDKSLKLHLSSEPDSIVEPITSETECIILASDGLWKVGHFPSLAPASSHYFWMENSQNRKIVHIMI